MNLDRQVIKLQFSPLLIFIDLFYGGRFWPTQMRYISMIKSIPHHWKKSQTTYNFQLESTFQFLFFNTLIFHFVFI